MKVRFEFLLTTATRILFLAILAAAPALAQTDTGNAGFNNTAEVDAPGATEYLGAANNVVDGATQLGPAVVGGTVYFNVVTSAAGNLHVWIDEDIDSDFVDDDGNQRDFVIAGAGTTHIAVTLNSTIAGSPYFRFIFEEGTNLVTDPDTDYTGSVDGEIEDYQVLVVAAGANVSMDAESGGVTTTVDANGADLEVTSGGDLIFQHLLQT